MSGVEVVFTSGAGLTVRRRLAGVLRAVADRLDPQARIVLQPGVAVAVTAHGAAGGGGGPGGGQVELR